VLAAFASACGGSGSGKAGGGTLNGAGSTFAAPLYGQTGSEFKTKNGTAVNYQSVGSGEGVAQFIANTVDFGATDVALKDEELAKAAAKSKPLDIPVAFGAITVSYNVSGAPKDLKLDGPTLANIFLGKITKWNDPAIMALNSGATLPDTAITVVHRSDGSGTTKQFTSFLAAYSPEFKSKVGSDKSVPWPVGTGAKGTEGVASGVKQTAGSIGYVELAYALQNNFTTAAVKNKAGAFITPSLASTSAAGDGLQVPDDLRFTAIDSPGPKAYPISSATFAVVYQDPCKAGKKKDQAQRLVNYLSYLLADGQKSAEKLNYAPLPAAIQAKAVAAVASMQCDGSALKPTS